jgi:hypothetical protein
MISMNNICRENSVIAATGRPQALQSAPQRSGFTLNSRAGRRTFNLRV